MINQQFVFDLIDFNIKLSIYLKVVLDLSPTNGLGLNFHQMDL